MAAMREHARKIDEKKLAGEKMGKGVSGAAYGLLYGEPAPSLPAKRKGTGVKKSGFCA